MVLRLLVSQRRGSKSTATCHEDPVALNPAETEVGTGFEQVSLTDQITVRRKEYVLRRILLRPSQHWPRHYRRSRKRYGI